MELKKIVSICRMKTLFKFYFPDGNINFDANCEYFLDNKKLNLFQVLNLNLNLKKDLILT